MSDVILFTRGTKGDLYPFLDIGVKLKDQGHSVTMVTNARYESYAKDFGFLFHALDDEELFEALNNTPSFHTNLSAKLQLSKEYIVAHIQREVLITQNALTNKDDTFILAHSNDYLVPLLVKELVGVPVHLCMLAPSYIHSFKLFEALLYGVGDQLNDVRQRLGLGPVFDWKSWAMQFDRCVAIWPEWFSQFEQDMGFDIEYLGFLSVDNIEKKEVSPELSSFISVDENVIFITHGTSRPFNDEYFSLVIDACSNLDCRLVVSTPFKSLLPKHLPPNVMWVEYAPFNTILGEIDLLIHHGGIGTVKEAIANCVPQLIIGQGFDRQHNGNIVKKLKLGDVIFPKEICTEIVRDLIMNLLSDKTIIESSKKYKDVLYDLSAVQHFIDFTSAGVKGDRLDRLRLEETKTIDVDADKFHVEWPFFSTTKGERVDDPQLQKRALILKLLKERAKLQAVEND